jgi:ubiquinone/menaquinone biosynthesis C-methylase UbiE
MLAEARRKPHSRRARYARGRGEAIPLADQPADLIFMSMVLHHFDDHRIVARECHRVLHNNGIVFLRAGTVDQIPAYPYIECFPST